MSISAAIGFIALSGIAVLNGVVLMAALRQLEARPDAIRRRRRRSSSRRGCGQS